MALTQNGIDYICQNFGDNNSCCIDSGLGWTYQAGGTGYNETGGTAQIVSRLASGLVDSLEMTNPARGIFTQSDLNNANGQSVTLQDAQLITQHDNPAEEQWCYEGVIVCSDYITQASCLEAGCYWYNESCHSSPYVPPEEGGMPWMLLGIGAIVVTAAVVYYYTRKPGPIKG